MRLCLRQSLLADKRVYDVPTLSCAMGVPVKLLVSSGGRERGCFGAADFSLAAKAGTRMQVLAAAEQGLELK